MRAFLLSSAAFANLGYHMSVPADTSAVPSLVAAAQSVEARDGDEMLKRAPDMEAMVPYWDKTDAIVEGYDTIRRAGRTYLPSFSKEDDDEYNNRLSLTKFTNVYRDIVEGLASKPFEEEVTFAESEESSKAPKELEDFAEDVDGNGNNLTIFLSLTFFNGINSAIDWIFVDYPTVDQSVIRTMADQKAAKIKPYWTHVLGRNVFAARTKLINGKHVLSYIRIFEPGTGTKDHIRIFQRDDTGVVTWELWVEADERNQDKKKFVLEASGVLSIDEIPLVPFITGRRDGNTFKIFPAMQDAADLQIDLYQQESALKFISTLAAYPMLAANGLKPQLEADGKTVKKVTIGPGRVLYGVPDGKGNHGSWEYVEPASSSMAFLQTKIEDTKKDLRELGRQPLTANSGNLTVITTAVAAGKARSAVSAWALGLKDAGENALVITCKFMKVQGYEPELNVYNEFDSFTDGGADLVELGSARRAGDISRVTYWSELRRRKVLAPEFNAETEEERLLDEVPTDKDLEDDTSNRNGLGGRNGIQRTKPTVVPGGAK